MRVEVATEVLAPPERVFEILADLTERAQFMADLETWEHLSGPRVGEGGQYRLRTRVGPVALVSIVQIVDWKPPELFAWSSLKGLRTWGHFVVKPTPRGSLVRLRLGYASSESVLGFVVDRFAAPLVRQQASKALLSLTSRITADLQRKVGRAARRGRIEIEGPDLPAPVAARSAKQRTGGPAPKRTRREPTPSSGTSRKTAAKRSSSKRTARSKGLRETNGTPVKRPSSGTKPASA